MGDKGSNPGTTARTFRERLVAITASLVIAALIGAATTEAGSPPPSIGRPPTTIPGTRHVLYGVVQPSGKVTMTVRLVRIRHQRLRAYTWKFRNLRLHCAGRPAVFRGFTAGEAIRNRDADRFGYRVFFRDAPPRRSSLTETVSGRLLDPLKPLRRRRRATGFVRVNGSRVPLRGGGHAKCDSGRLRWSADQRKSWSDSAH